MEKYSFFVGIDISKGHLDFCIRNSSVRLGFNRVPNDPGGIKEELSGCAPLRASGKGMPGMP